MKNLTITFDGQKHTSTELLCGTLRTITIAEIELKNELKIKDDELLWLEWISSYCNVIALFPTIREKYSKVRFTELPVVTMNNFLSVCTEVVYNWVFDIINDADKAATEANEAGVTIELKG